VGSTGLAASLGDHRWRELLERHRQLVRIETTRFGGQELATAGDGTLARFDGPARAVRAGLAVVAAMRDLGIEVRVGIHTGEVEITDRNLAGIALHIGARIQGEAEPGEVLVSSTVRDLVVGSELEFEPRGDVELRGVPGTWRLYTATRP
jgi:class 3 adenylate cyclase